MADMTVRSVHVIVRLAAFLVTTASTPLFGVTVQAGSDVSAVLLYASSWRAQSWLTVGSDDLAAGPIIQVDGSSQGRRDTITGAVLRIGNRVHADLAAGRAEHIYDYEGTHTDNVGTGAIVSLGVQLGGWGHFAIPLTIRSYPGTDVPTKTSIDVVPLLGLNLRI